ncbi:rhodanese-like domain-containing protein (plasmid) [Deinococcus sp. KNUC1210]|uniref:rhodanese-like domain-containing protein n=1 Tax=Deinococcus sp. KNUC1210 TaxID=2917691 RepID=UPI001EF0D04A|nr:rhodanese-like domain-containing protein [Deinococcus sp. KNUC1210]ULH17860.1 rhodanese-like domain-containing protein [Deinococcus sp. KNUC1210]
MKGLLGSGTDNINVSATEAQGLLKSGALLLDVRSKGERQAILIPGSKHIPVEQLTSELGQLPRSKVIVCQCASGHRSGLAARQLRAQGFDARSLSGGITAWKNAGLPVKKG